MQRKQAPITPIEVIDLSIDDDDRNQAPENLKKTKTSVTLIEEKQAIDALPPTTSEQPKECPEDSDSDSDGDDVVLLASNGCYLALTQKRRRRNKIK
jgi:hypothetical protein